MPVSENTDGILQHKRLVASYIQQVINDLIKRAVEHDYSKFSPEEFDAFEEATPNLKNLVYGWIAATRRVKDGDIDKGLVINKERFHIDDQLFQIIKNTVDSLK